MRIIPGIDEKTFGDVKKRFRKAAELLEKLPELERWVHIDVTDGKFTSYKTWNNPAELKKLQVTSYKLQVKFEIHLMIEKPEWFIGDWLKSGANRAIIHYEAMEFKENSMLFGESVVLALKPETPAPRILETAKYAKQILLLAVPPGPAGQVFDTTTLEKIKFLRAKLPGVTIEVDGGVNPDSARECKIAGADILVSTSYLSKSSDPAKAYQELLNV